MFTAHLPAGYIATHTILARYSSATRQTYRPLLYVGLMAAILPDLDLFYFYFIDECQHLHHTYWTHLPIFWFALLLGAMIVAMYARRKIVWLVIAVFFGNIFLHLLLDTLVGHVLWFYPFSTYSVAFFHVEPRFGWWVWNFILHWTFLLEATLWVYAITLLHPAE